MPRTDVCMQVDAPACVRLFEETLLAPGWRRNTGPNGALLMILNIK